uniref:METMALONYL_COA_MUTASE domain-containing protein n=1 Tax=Gongylonema pulchrum TaxID=637853 RepID=A0A183DAJ4_9BILA
LESITEAAKGTGNLMDAAVEASRARCTVGEISDAMEKVFSRYAATIRMVSGAYKSAYGDNSEIANVMERVNFYFIHCSNATLRNMSRICLIIFT